MKLTTKIIGGVMLLVILITVAFIAYLSQSKYAKEGNQNYDVMISSDMESIHRGEGISTILFEDVPLEDERSVFFTGSIHLVPVSKSDEQSKVELPSMLRPYIEEFVKGDTLVLRIKTKELIIALSNDPDGRFPSVGGLNFNVFVDTSSIGIKNNLRYDMNLDMRGVKCDNVALNVSARVISVDSCNIKSLTVANITNMGCRFDARNSTIKTLNVDLDNITDRVIENCNIDIENLTGSSIHRISVTKGECKEMNWVPKNEDASLRIFDLSDTVRIVFP